MRCACVPRMHTSREDCDLGEEASLPSDGTTLANRMTVSSELTDDATSALDRRGDGHLTGLVMLADLRERGPASGQLSCPSASKKTRMMPASCVWLPRSRDLPSFRHTLDVSS